MAAPHKPSSRRRTDPAAGAAGCAADAQHPHAGIVDRRVDPTTLALLLRPKPRLVAIRGQGPTGERRHQAQVRRALNMAGLQHLLTTQTDRLVVPSDDVDVLAGPAGPVAAAEPGV